MAIPTKTIVEQIYQGETIKCAKIESAISSFYKFPGIVNAEGDYEFQAVIRSEETSRIGIQVGDAAVRYIDTYPSFSRYVLPFKQITINESDSLYLPSARCVLLLQPTVGAWQRGNPVATSA